MRFSAFVFVALVGLSGTTNPISYMGTALRRTLGERQPDTRLSTNSAYTDDESPKSSSSSTSRASFTDGLRNSFSDFAGAVESMSENVIDALTGGDDDDDGIPDRGSYPKSSVSLSHDNVVKGWSFLTGVPINDINLDRELASYRANRIESVDISRWGTASQKVPVGAFGGGRNLSGRSVELELFNPTEDLDRGTMVYEVEVAPNDADDSLEEEGDEYVDFIESIPLDNYLIQYTRYPSMGNIHDDLVLVDAYFSKLVSNVFKEDCRRVAYVSRSAQEPDEVGKLLIRPDQSHMGDEPSFKFRFMIMERFGPYLAKYVEFNELELVDIVNFGVQMMMLVEHLHQLNIVHADIGLKSFVVSPDTQQLKLTDFGFARIIHGPNDFANGERTEDEKFISSEGDDAFSCHAYNSLWGSYRLKPSFRDDVHRVLVAMQLMVFGSDLEEEITRLCTTHNRESREHMLKSYMSFKSSQDMFDLPLLDNSSSSQPYSIKDRINVSNQAQGRIMKHFRQAGLEVLQTRIHEKPNHQRIIDHLTAISRDLDDAGWIIA